MGETHGNAVHKISSRVSDDANMFSCVAMGDAVRCGDVNRGFHPRLNSVDRYAIKSQCTQDMNAVPFHCPLTFLNS